MLMFIEDLDVDFGRMNIIHCKNYKKSIGSFRENASFFNCDGYCFFISDFRILT